jgi:hypothetical protein
MTIGEIRTIKRETGLSITGLHAKLLSVKDADNVDDMDLYASLVYLLMSKSGETVTWADVEAIPIVDLAAGLSVLPDEPAEQSGKAVEPPPGEVQAGEPVTSDA